ncbi:MAG: glycosyltransferase family 2 protein [Candidatus Spyradenecus sp.]
MRPVFSLIIPVYHVAADLLACLGSIAVQRETWEAICIDDGCLDACGELLDNAARCDARIRVVHQRNKGVSAARNRGLNLAQGAWLWFIDADDAIHPEALMRLRNVLDKAPDVQAVVFERITGECIPQQWVLQEEKPCLVRNHSVEMLNRFESSGWRVLFRRVCLGTLRFPDYIIGEDGLFSLQYYLQTSSWLVVEWPLYFYRMRQDSVMHTAPSVRFVQDWLNCFYERVCLFVRDYVISDGGGRDLFRGGSCTGVVHARRNAFCVAKTCWAEITAAVVAFGPGDQCCSTLSPSSAIAALPYCRKPLLSSCSVAHYWPLSHVECVVRSLPVLAANDARPAQQIIFPTKTWATPSLCERRVA